MKIFRRVFLNRYGTLVCDEFRWLPSFNRCKLTINIFSDWDSIVVVDVSTVSRKFFEVVIPAPRLRGGRLAGIQKSGYLPSQV